MKNKIGRNELCPCGSGKKYKKCCLGRSKNNGHDELEKLMQDGYSLSEKEEITEACKIWLEVWNKLKIRFRPEMKNIKVAEKIFPGLQSYKKDKIIEETVYDYSFFDYLPT